MKYYDRINWENIKLSWTDADDERILFSKWGFFLKLNITKLVSACNESFNASSSENTNIKFLVFKLKQKYFVGW